MFSSGKLRDLEDELAASHKKYTELQKQNAKLQSDLTKKESLIDAQVNFLFHNNVLQIPGVFYHSLVMKSYHLFQFN